MKTDNSSVAHEFASNSINLSVYSGTMSLHEVYNTKKENIIGLKSYNTFIALRNLTHNYFMISKRTYSNTTSRHQGLIHGAMFSDILKVYDVNDTLKNNLQYEIDTLKDLALKHMRARKNSYEYYIIKNINNIELILQYKKIDKRSALYKTLQKIISLKNDFDNLLIYLSNMNELEAKRLKQLQLKKKRELKKNFLIFKNQYTVNYINDLIKARVEAFYNIDDNSKLYYKLSREYMELQNEVNNWNIRGFKTELKDIEFIFNHKDILRITKNCNVVTSQNVTISKNEAIALYLKIVKNKFKSGDTVLKWNFIKQTNDYIEVGCHTMAITDIKAIYNKLVECEESSNV